MVQTNKIYEVSFDLIDYESVFEKIKTWRSTGTHSYITITNPYSVMMCRKNSKMAQAHTLAGLTLPDGIGIILAANILGFPHCGRVTGPELMLKVCDWGREYGMRHFFYGGSKEVAKLLGENLTQKFPSLEIAGVYSPGHKKIGEKESEDVINMINASKPDILWVGLGAPKQEIWMLDHLDKINSAVMIGVGAAFDFHSGNAKWAPKAFRKKGLEWLWRLILEPKRMIQIGRAHV